MIYYSFEKFTTKSISFTEKNLNLKFVIRTGIWNIFKNVESNINNIHDAGNLIMNDIASHISTSVFYLVFCQCDSNYLLANLKICVFNAAVYIVWYRFNRDNLIIICEHFFSIFLHFFSSKHGKRLDNKSHIFTRGIKP